MGRTQNEEEPAVECSYWHFWPNNFTKEESGVNVFLIDCKESDGSIFRDFISGEACHNSLIKICFQVIERILFATERNAKLRCEGYKKPSEM